MSNAKATIIALVAVIFTFVLTETWHGVCHLIDVNAEMSERSGPKVFFVSKSEIADLHKKGLLQLDGNGNVLALKREQKSSETLARSK